MPHYLEIFMIEKVLKVSTSTSKEIVDAYYDCSVGQQALTQMGSENAAPPVIRTRFSKCMNIAFRKCLFARMRSACHIQKERKSVIVAEWCPAIVGTRPLVV
jgi:hypothetical protein